MRQWRWFLTKEIFALKILSCCRLYFCYSLFCSFFKRGLLALFQTTLKAAIDSRDSSVDPLAPVNIEVNSVGDSKYVTGKSSYEMSFSYMWCQIEYVNPLPRIYRWNIWIFLSCIHQEFFLTSTILMMCQYINVQELQQVNSIRYWCFNLYWYSPSFHVRCDILFNRLFLSSLSTLRRF